VYKNYKNPLRDARVIVENKVAPFVSGHGVYSIVTLIRTMFPCQQVFASAGEQKKCTRLTADHCPVRCTTALAVTTTVT